MAEPLDSQEPLSGPSVTVPVPDPGEDGDDGDTAELLPGQRQPRPFWTFEYYRAFFDVDTRQVLERIKASLMPVPGKNFVRHRLRNNPDLYGPFWICATLGLALAISGDLSQLGSARGGSGPRYRPRFHYVPVALSLVFSYAGLVPLALWGALRWARGGSGRDFGGSFSLLETLSAYGYSLAALVPAAVLWAAPVAWLRWAVLALLALPSAAALAVTFWPPCGPGAGGQRWPRGRCWWPCTPCWPWAASSISSSPSPRPDLGGPPRGSPPLQQLPPPAVRGAGGDPGIGGIPLTIPQISTPNKIRDRSGLCPGDFGEPPDPSRPPWEPPNSTWEPQNPPENPQAHLGTPKIPLGTPKIPLGTPKPPLGIPKPPQEPPKLPWEPQTPLGTPPDPPRNPQIPSGTPKFPLGTPKSPWEPLNSP